MNIEKNIKGFFLMTSIRKFNKNLNMYVFTQPLQHELDVIQSQFLSELQLV